MKKLLLILALAVPFFTGCSKHQNKTVNPAINVTVSLHEKQVWTTQYEGVSITFDSIKADYRDLYPSTVEPASAVFHFKDGNNIYYFILMYPSHIGNDTTIGTYKIYFTNLLPWPTPGKQISPNDYVATLNIIN